MESFEIRKTLLVQVLTSQVGHWVLCGGQACLRR